MDDLRYTRRMTELDLIAEMLAEAGSFVRRQYRRNAALSVKTKQDAVDLVTEADIATQKLIVERIHAVFPGDAIVGEEEGHDHPPDDPDARCWVIDPIDGTHNFSRSLVPSFGVSVAFADGGETQAAGVAIPLLDETFLAARGEGAMRNGEPARVSDIDRIAHAKITCDFTRPTHRAAALAVTAPITPLAGQIRCHGSAVVSLCDVACGAAEAYVHGSLSPWDYAAGMLIVTEAGGRATRLDGSELKLFDNRKGLLTTNGAIHEHLLDLLKDVELPSASALQNHT